MTKHQGKGKSNTENCGKAKTVTNNFDKQRSQGKARTRDKSPNIPSLQIKPNRDGIDQTKK